MSAGAEVVRQGTDNVDAYTEERTIYLYTADVWRVRMMLTRGRAYLLLELLLRRWCCYHLPRVWTASM